MKISSWVTFATKKLNAVGIGTARLDAFVLLEDVTGKDRSWLLAHSEMGLAAPQVAKLTKLLNRRVKHEPLAYIRGKTEFYGREFVLTPAVLEPRPESETMIDILKRLPSLPVQSRIADVGAGSGALGITAQLELPKAQIELLEIDSKATRVAKNNVDKFTLNIQVINSDLLVNATQQNDVLLCNLPYVPDGFQINPAAMREPRMAIFGGRDGLDIYRKLFQQVSKLLRKPLFILTEALPPQHDMLRSIAESCNYDLRQSADFIQAFEPSK